MQELIVQGEDAVNDNDDVVERADDADLGQDDPDEVQVKMVKGYLEQLVAFHERYRGWLDSLQAQPCEYIEVLDAIEELRKESLAVGWTISRGTTMMMGLLEGVIELPELEGGESN